MIARRIAPALAAVALAVALAGCGRAGQGSEAPVVPAPAASSTGTSAPAADDGDILGDLDAADAATGQAEDDAAAGDQAARTDDAP